MNLYKVTLHMMIQDLIKVIAYKLEISLHNKLKFLSKSLIF